MSNWSLVACSGRGGTPGLRAACQLGAAALLRNRSTPEDYLAPRQDQRVADRRCDSLIPYGCHRIDSRGFPRGHVTGEKHSAQENGCCPRRGSWAIRLYVEKKSFDKLRGAECRGHADREPRHCQHKGLPQHHPKDCTTLCSKRHPDPDLTRAPRDRVGHRPVQANTGDDILRLVRSKIFSTSVSLAPRWSSKGESWPTTGSHIHWQRRQHHHSHKRTYQT